MIDFFVVIFDGFPLRSGTLPAIICMRIHREKGNPTYVPYGLSRNGNVAEGLTSGGNPQKIWQPQEPCLGYGKEPICTKAWRFHPSKDSCPAGPLVGILSWYKEYPKSSAIDGCGQAVRALHDTVSHTPLRFQLQIGHPICIMQNNYKELHSFWEKDNFVLP